MKLILLWRRKDIKDKGHFQSTKLLLSIYYLFISILLKLSIVQRLPNLSNYIENYFKLKVREYRYKF